MVATMSAARRAELYATLARETAAQARALATLEGGWS